MLCIQGDAGWLAGVAEWVTRGSIWRAGGDFSAGISCIAPRNWRQGSANARETRRTCKQDGRGTKGPAELADGGLAVKNRARVAELDEQANEQAQRPQGH